MDILFPTWVNFNNTSVNADIHIFRLAVSEHLSKLSVYKKILSSEELLRSSRFYKAEDRERYIICRGALKQLLGQYLQTLPERIEIILDKNKKPVLKDRLQLHFNVSHSRGSIALAFSDNNIGIDVEYIDNNFDYKPIAKACFAMAEMDCLRESCNAAEEFFKLWTRKEAFLKANGKGLNDDMNQLNCLGELHEKQIAAPGYESYRIDSFKIEENYIAAVAYNCSREKLRFYTI